MESTTKKVILPTKGICNATPDKICDDTELLDAEGLTYHNSAYHPIQKTVTIGTAPGTIMHVHTLNDGHTKNIISANGNTLYSNSNTIATLPAEIKAVKSIGNTLIVNTKNGLHYYLWEGNSYRYLGNKLPEPNVKFRLSKHINGGFINDTENTQAKNFNPFTTDATETICCNYATIEGILDVKQTFTQANITIANKTAWNDVIYGTYAKNKNDIHNKGGFINPFFICYAIELYDGSHYMVSNPILLYPSIRRNSHALSVWSDQAKAIEVITGYAVLEYQSLASFEGWEDIVKNITIFATSEIDIYDTSTDAKLNIPEDEYLDYYYHDYIAPGYNSDRKFQFITAIHHPMFPFTNTGDSDMERNIRENSVFYKIADIPAFSTQTSWASLSKKINGSVLKNLTTQQQLKNIDFYSHCTLTPSYIETFNRRLNMAGVKRGIFEGFDSFMPYTYNGREGEQSRSYKIAVAIKTNDGTKFVVKSFSSPDIICQRGWFFYPDPRAKYAIINGNRIELKEHSGLNGAYYFGGMPTGTDMPYAGTTTQQPSADLYEHLPNYLLQSEVDNPFTFFAHGYVRVGQGTILAMAGLTTALTQDAYKVSTTLVFTTQGIWALTINAQGQYAAVAPPFSREVLWSPSSATAPGAAAPSSFGAVSTAPLIMIDNAIFFVSEKGLMLITDNGIQCVSEHLAGKNPEGKEAVYGNISQDALAEPHLNAITPYQDFLPFLCDATCRIAYDYRDSQLIITNQSFNYHWVYNIKSGTFTRFNDGYKYKAIVTDYPDTLLQDESNNIHSVLQEPNINHDPNTYSGYLITRPMKFEESIHLKSIRELMHIDDLNPDATITITIFASNDCRTWHEIKSLAGRGFKYFIFRYDFTGLKATDTFMGTLIGYDTRNTYKIR